MRRVAQEVDNQVELIDMVLPGKQGLSREHLGENAPGTPEVYLHAVSLPCQHDFRCSIIACRHIAGHLMFLHSCEPKIAYLQVAILVNQNIARLEVPMDNAGGVDVLQTTLWRLS